MKSREGGRLFTNLVKHLVAFIEDKDLAASESEMLVSYKGIQTTRSGDNDMRMGVLILEESGILLDWDTTVENSSSNIWHILAEASIFVLDLISQLACMAHNKD